MGTAREQKVSAVQLVSAIFAIAVLVFLATGTPSRAPIASSETRFVEHSASGLQIVPASCPSDPHYDGECSVGYSEASYYSQSSYTSYSQGSYGYSQGSYSTGDPSCPIGYTMQNGTCVYVGCPSTHILQNGVCIPRDINQCGGFYCSGSSLYEYYVSSNQCRTRLNQECAWGCSGNGCLAAPRGEGNITARPALVRSGETTLIEWTTSNMQEESCSVVDDNPDLTTSDTRLNGSITTGAIRQQTTFTLRCTDLAGNPFSDSVRVNIIPVFQEN